MLTLAASTFSLKTESCLHVIHPKEKHNPRVMKQMQNIHASFGQVIDAGIHFLTVSRFRRFESVIVHDCDPAYLKDYLKRLKTLSDRMPAVAEDRARNLVFMGNTISLLGPEVLLLPQTGNVFCNEIARNVEIDDKSPGLNLITTRWNTITNEQLDDHNYMEALRYCSRKGPIYLLGMNTIYTGDGRVLFGKMYEVTPAKIRTITDVPEHMTFKALTAHQKRDIGSITFHYDDEIDQDLEDVESTDVDGEQKPDLEVAQPKKLVDVPEPPALQKLSKFVQTAKEAGANVSDILGSVKNKLKE